MAKKTKSATKKMQPKDLGAIGDLHEKLVQAQRQLDEKGGIKSAGGPQEWNKAWKQKQLDFHRANRPKEDHSDPTPLLIDKISSLPPSSARRKSAETFKGVFDNTTANVGHGTDALTRESYKDLKRLAKSSPMIQSCIYDPAPSPGQLVGQEGGTVVNNLQSWKPSVSNALKPVSDAIGSHAEATSSVTKSALGPTQMLPQTSLTNVKEISNDMVTHVENPFKSVQKGVLIQTPQKEAGSLRHISTAASPTLAVPFELASDAFTGLMGLVNKAAKMLDLIIKKITQFLISAIGGLIDGLFPSGMLAKLIKMIMSILKFILDLFSMLGGFTALAKMSNQMLAGLPLGCTGNLFSGNQTRGMSSRSSSKRTNPKNLGAIVGKVGKLGNALGNLGSMIGKGTGKNIGGLTANISHPNQLLDKTFDSLILKLLSKLPFMCSTHNTGNRGYSVGDKFDKLLDNAFSVAMRSYAAHSSIISPNFNKKATSVGKYSNEGSIGFFEQLPFGRCAQGNKGVIMHGPGSTQGKKVFRI